MKGQRTKCIQMNPQRSINIPAIFPGSPYSSCEDMRIQQSTTERKKKVPGCRNCIISLNNLGSVHVTLTFPSPHPINLRMTDDALLLSEQCEWQEQGWEKSQRCDTTRWVCPVRHRRPYLSGDEIMASAYSLTALVSHICCAAVTNCP